MSAVTVKSLAQRKARRQKQILAVGSVVLLAVLGYQLPKLLGRSSETAPAVTTTSSSVMGSSPAVPAGKLPDTGLVVIQRDSNQLLSFGLFKSKDPFVQQLSTDASTPAASPAPAPAPVPATKRITSKPKPASSPPLGVGLTPPATTTTTTPATTTPATSTEPSNPPAASGPSVTTPASPGTTPTSTSPAAPGTAPADVLISTNGVCERVALKGTFPGDEDIFTVVSIAKDGKSVEIGVVGGSYDSGQATATLKRGEKLTLVNTADGTRYVIALESKCNAQAQSSHTTPTAPVATAPPTTTTTTPTTTTPIVTDSLDTTTTPK
jgi:hypothetical protein